MCTDYKHKYISFNFFIFIIIRFILFIYIISKYLIYGNLFILNTLTTLDLILQVKLSCEVMLIFFLQINVIK